MFGREVALLTHLIDVHTSTGSGLRAQEVNGADRQSFESARRFLLPSVRQSLASMPGTLGTIVYLYFASLLAAAVMNRTMSMAARLELAFQCLHFIRYWRAWVVASDGYTLASNFISAQLHVDTVILVHSLVLLIVIWQRQFPQHTFCPWLMGSDQLEHAFSEFRAFVQGNTNWTFLGFLRWFGAGRTKLTPSLAPGPQWHLKCPRTDTTNICTSSSLTPEQPQLRALFLSKRLLPSFALQFHLFSVSCRCSGWRQI